MYQETLSLSLFFLAALCVSAKDSKSTRGIDLGIINPLQQVGEFTNVGSVNNKDALCLESNQRIAIKLRSVNFYKYTSLTVWPVSQFYAFGVLLC